MSGVAARGRTRRERLAKVLRGRGWNRSEFDHTIRSRIYHAIYAWRPWWDWGHPVMWLVGRDDGGNPGAPRARDLYYVHVSWLEAWQRPYFEGQQDRLGFITTTDYGIIRQHRDVSWKIFDLQDDGHTLLLGWYPHPDSDGRIRPAAIDHNELRLLLRWLLITNLGKAQWFGLRPWLYYKALHAAVHRKVPFSCQAVPTRGGYPHWHCQLKRRHTGDHRVQNYTWADGQPASYEPVRPS